MKSDIFKFKSFSILQKDSAMKVGTDGVLLGAWATRELGTKGTKILDIGSGTGVISLIAAHRCDKAEITALEIDSDAANESSINFEQSKWSDRLQVERISVQEFASQSENQGVFDCIITNPPYFINSLKNPDASRVAARHAELLPYEDLIDSVDKLLSKDGDFFVILPYKESSILLMFAAIKGLHLRKRVDVYGSSSSSIVKRSMLLLTRTKGDTANSTITIRQGDSYSEKYVELTKDLYLKF